VRTYGRIAVIINLQAGIVDFVGNLA